MSPLKVFTYSTPGRVKLDVYFHEGYLYYEVVGTGSGTLPWFNSQIGMILFTPGVRQIVDEFAFPPHESVTHDIVP